METIVLLQNDQSIAQACLSILTDEQKLTLETELSKTSQ